MFSVFYLSFKKLNEASCFQVASFNFLILHSAFCIMHSFVVEISGIEPLTSCLQGRRSPSWAKPPYPFFCSFCILHSALCIMHSLKWWAKTRFPAGKPRRLQQSTGLLPRAAFRVHFGAMPRGTQSSRSWLPFSAFWEVVGQNGLEPSTSRLSVVCSSQLSYWPISTSHFSDTAFPVPSKLNNAILTLNTLYWP